MAGRVNEREGKGRTRVSSSPRTWSAAASGYAGKSAPAGARVRVGGILVCLLFVEGCRCWRCVAVDGGQAGDRSRGQAGASFLCMYVRTHEEMRGDSRIF